MSGGSFDYLCCKEFPEICERQSTIREMSERLIELGYPDAAKETEKLILDIDAFEVRINAKLERLQPIWRSVEWFDSGDSDRKSVNETIENYRNL